MLCIGEKKLDDDDKKSSEIRLKRNLLLFESVKASRKRLAPGLAANFI